MFVKSIKNETMFQLPCINIFLVSQKWEKTFKIFGKYVKDSLTKMGFIKNERGIFDGHHWKINATTNCMCNATIYLARSKFVLGVD